MADLKVSFWIKNPTFTSNTFLLFWQPIPLYLFDCFLKAREHSIEHSVHQQLKLEQTRVCIFPSNSEIFVSNLKLKFHRPFESSQKTVIHSCPCKWKTFLNTMPWHDQIVTQDPTLKNPILYSHCSKSCKVSDDRAWDLFCCLLLGKKKTK